MLKKTHVTTHTHTEKSNLLYPIRQLDVTGIVVILRQVKARKDSPQQADEVHGTTTNNYLTDPNRLPHVLFVILN